MTIYMRVYRGKKFEDMNPVDILPNDKYLVTYGGISPVTVLARAIFNDTGTIHDCSPANLGYGNQYQINCIRNLNDHNIENRIGVTHGVTLD